jgi:hypothetical protein
VKVTRTIATGVFFGWMCQNSLAVHPPGIDRPSPPPCCADGQCFASPLTYGYYDTRWRRWPLETMSHAATVKPGTPSVPLPQDVPAFVTPPPELEDRKAPPPSVPLGEQAPTGAAPSGPSRTPGAPGGPAAPQGTQPPAGGPSFTTPPTTPMAPPAAPGTQPKTGPAYKNVSPDSPLNRSGSSPMGDADPPPSLPFGPTLVAPEQPMREVSQRPAVTAGRIASSIAERETGARSVQRSPAGAANCARELRGLVSRGEPRFSRAAGTLREKVACSCRSA